MRRPLQPLALLLLIAGLGPAALSAAACGLDHCPRPQPASRERPSAAWSIKHTDLTRGAAQGDFTQGALHLRYPLGRRWAAGSHLPFGYLRNAGAGHWGASNPMAYAEWIARPAPGHAFTFGLQVELPFGDTRSGIASAHAMAMPFATHAWRGRGVLTHLSLGFAAQVPDGHSHADASGPDGHAHNAETAEAPLQAKPHEPYELLYRIGAAFPWESAGFEPEAFLTGARVVAGGSGIDRDFVGIGVGLGIRASRSLLIKPRFERQLTRPARFAWSTGLEFKVDFRGL